MPCIILDEGRWLKALGIEVMPLSSTTLRLLCSYMCAHRNTIFMVSQLILYISTEYGKIMEISPMPTDVSVGRDRAGGCLISVELVEFARRWPRPFANR